MTSKVYELDWTVSWILKKTHLIRNMIEYGICPDQFKMTVTLHKGDKTQLDNFRPVANVAKIFEKVIKIN